MYIKNIYNIRNFKGIPNGFRVNFSDITYILGDNAKNKTTIGSIPLWILTGYSLTGCNSENVASEQLFNTPNTTASMTIIDNDGSEHTITRCKGKDNFVLLDDTRTTKEILTKYFKDIHSFICAYNPSYFRSLNLSEQRELLVRILPAITAQEAFNFLNEEEKRILEAPVEDVKEFNKNKRRQNKEYLSDLDRLKGSKSIYVDIAIQKEETLKIFDKQNQLKQLEDEYEKLMTNSDEILSLDEIQERIKKIEDRIYNNIKVELIRLQEDQRNELKKLEDVSSVSSTCPTCRQEIKNPDLVRALERSFRKNINNLAEQIEKLKNETTQLLVDKKIQIDTYNKLKTPEMQELANKREVLKQQIDALYKEKNEIDLFNKEVSIKHNQIVEAKRNIESISREIVQLTETIESNNKKIEVAKKLEFITIQKQMDKVRNYLKNVTIEFSKFDEISQEYIDSYEIRYNGKLYEHLSKSYKLRADIEIANLINKVMDIQAPMFIDDVESITNIDIEANTQTILAIVVKYNELEILNSYTDVLQREKESVNKKIQESSNLLQVAA